MGATELYYKPWTYFWIVQSLGLLLLFGGIAYKFGFYFSAQKKSLYKKPAYLLMARALVREVLLQKQLAQKGIIRWLNHMMLFYGFAGLLMLSAIAVVLETVVPAGSAFSRFMLYGQGRFYYKAAGDLFGLMILLALILPFLRRYIWKDKQLSTDYSDTLALVFLFLLVASGFLLESLRIAMAGTGPELPYSFVGYALARLFRGLDGIASLATALWVFHATLNALLLAYLPHSKFLHIINSPVEIMLNASEERMRGDLYL